MCAGVGGNLLLGHEWQPGGSRRLGAARGGPRAGQGGGDLRELRGRGGPAAAAARCRALERHAQAPQLRRRRRAEAAGPRPRLRRPPAAAGQEEEEERRVGLLRCPG